LELENVIQVLYDRNENLWGKFIPLHGGIEIQSPENLLLNPPEYLVIFATSYSTAIVDSLRKDGYSGKVVLIYPEIKVI
jgi:hypothetical protein